MTVTYTAEVATCLKFGSFIKLLARWRGSIYKLIWMDLLLFLVLYYSLHVIYYYIISENGYKEAFENIVVYCSSYLSLIPLSFVLGFYVNLVMSRWWEQYISIPWPDSVAVFVSACVHGQDEGGRLMRRTIMRYVCLCLTIVFTMISPGVKKRFPNMKYLVEAGLLLENERLIFEKLDNAFPKYPKHWMPIIWAASIITRARKEGRIRDDFAVKTIIDELNDFRGRCGTLLYYDFISIPLVYTQVVTIAVYSFFLCSLLAHQWTEKKNNTHEELDFYYPIFISLQFFFYMGWLKVAETLINPFGEDDDDFEIHWMIDRNLQVSYLIVDEMHHEHPELLRDQYWDEVYPSELPYMSEAKKEKHPESSTARYDLIGMPKDTDTRTSSKANLLVMNGRMGSTISSSRSQRFSEAFKRFLNYSQAGLRPDVDNSFQSDIEALEKITSYTYSGQAEFEPTIENEPITEESEAILEKLEEENTTNVENEDDRIETQSSHESDSDSDPFERLRLGRQKQRLQRMNDFVERYFGSNFRIRTQFPNTKRPKFNSSAREHSYSKHFAQDNIEIFPNQFEVKLDKSIIEIEGAEVLLTPNVSTATKIQKSDISQKQTNRDFEKNNEHLNLSAIRIFMMPHKNAIETKSSTEIQQDIRQNLSGDTAQEESSVQESQIPFSLKVSNVGIQQAELMETQGSILANVSHFILEPTSTLSTQPEQESASLTLETPSFPRNLLTVTNAEIPPSVSTGIEQSSSTFKDTNRAFDSQATSPLGSPVGSWLQSSFSDCEILVRDAQSTDQHRTEQGGAGG